MRRTSRPLALSGVILSVILLAPLAHGCRRHDAPSIWSVRRCHRRERVAEVSDALGEIDVQPVRDVAG